MKTQIILVLSCLALQAFSAKSKYNEDGEDNPYEFGFTIDGQQHRHEKKDSNGIIQGEFGFITADGIYHVTVYATDENGNFKILSMRNVRVSGPLDEPNAKLPDTSQFGKGNPKPVPNPLAIASPAPPPVSAVQTTQRSHVQFTTQPTIKPACAGCGYVTTPKNDGKLPFQTQAFQNPKPGTVIIGNKPGNSQNDSPFNVANLPNQQGGLGLPSTKPQIPSQPGASFPSGLPQIPSQQAGNGVPSTFPQIPSQQGGSSLPSKIPQVPSQQGGNGLPSNFPQIPSQGGNDSPSKFPQIPSRPVGNGLPSKFPQIPSQQGGNGLPSIFPQIPSQQGGGHGLPSAFPQNPSQQGGNGLPSKFPQIPAQQGGNGLPSTFPQIPSQQGGGHGLPSAFPQNPSQQGGNGLPSKFPQIPAQQGGNGVPSTFPQIPSQQGGNSLPSNFPQITSQQGGNGLPSTFPQNPSPQGGNGFLPNPQQNNPTYPQINKPGIISQSPIANPLAIGNDNNVDTPPSGITVDNNVINIPNNDPIPIRDKYPGMVDGLPAGITKNDITDLLYKFNYTVGFHGHYEKGYKNGAKVGGYFVNDRDGVSRIVTYVADENGYRPKVKFIRLDLNSDLVPKEGSEKKFGLKNFEFVWYPLK